MNGTHIITITDCLRLETNGVRDVKSFNETELVLTLSGKTLYIGGADLKIEKMSVETGELILSGMISSLYMTDETAVTEKRGFISRVFG